MSSLLQTQMNAYLACRLTKYKQESQYETYWSNDGACFRCQFDCRFDVVDVNLSKYLRQFIRHYFTNPP